MRLRNTLNDRNEYSKYLYKTNLNNKTKNTITNRHECKKQNKKQLIKTVLKT